VVTAEANAAAVIKDVPAAQTAQSTPPSASLAQKLSNLKDAYDAQLITKGEYDAKRKELIEKL
jgi:hypothetical protein